MIIAPSDTASVAAMGAAVRSGAVTAEALTREALARIEAVDPLVHAFVHVDREGALAQAKAADQALAGGRDFGPMHGVPYALKDIFDVAGLPTTCHSKLRLDNVARNDSEVAARFRAGGAVLLGKLGTYEFAFGGPSFDLPFPPARNPWNLDHVTGGSSSGSAAAVSAGIVRVAPGSCTAGSIRVPAAWCGAVGLKPTYGRVSRRGVFPLAWTLDHCGPLARSVEDAAIALTVMAGHDPGDPASADLPVPDFRADLESGVAGLRIGVPRAFFAEHPALTFEARQAIDRALDLLRHGGAQVEDVGLPDYEIFFACGRVLMTAEMHALHRADLRARPQDYAEATLKRFVLGAAISSADYIDAQRLRRSLTGAVDAVLNRCDSLLTAVSLTPPPPFSTVAPPSTWPTQANMFNVTGHPALTVPVGLDSAGFPLAVQLVGRAFDESLVLRVGRFLERQTGWLEVPLPAPAQPSRQRPARADNSSSSSQPEPS
jgi:aspartyl-tRNA(Asn)/glutamyl-tRNA(Gln) amidotransferase subunit A